MDNGASSYHRFLEGDESGFDEILDSYRDNLIFFLNRYVHNLTVAEDLAADAFMDLLVHKHRYNFKTSFKTYLFMIGRSRAIDFLRHEKRARALEPSQDEAADYEALEERLVLQEQKRAVNAAIDKLSDDYKTVIHLIYFEELSYADAARVMKKNTKQIENLVYRAKKALRSELEVDAL